MIQQDAILGYMMQGNSITPLEALSRFGCFRLGARVYDLKKQGFDIRSEMVKDNGKHYARYRLVRKETQMEVFV